MAAPSRTSGGFWSPFAFGGAPKSSHHFKDLLAEARAGSSIAQGHLLDCCRRYLLLIANEALDSDLRPKAGASDIVQETFLDAFRDLGDFRGENEQELLAWLTHILRNRLANNVRFYRTSQRRAVNREVVISDGDEIAVPPIRSPEQDLIARDDQDRLREALASLPASMRDILVLRTWQRLSFPAIGSHLRCSPDAARKQWGRAVRQLQREMRREP
jgi:RNA polymerase sigma-70 factor (ECF subfamily)